MGSSQSSRDFVRRGQYTREHSRLSYNLQTGHPNRGRSSPDALLCRWLFQAGYF